MALDHARGVVCRQGGSDESGLLASVHGLAVDRENGGDILAQRALGQQPLELHPGALVDRRCVRVRVGREVNVGAIDMQKLYGFPAAIAAASSRFMVS